MSRTEENWHDGRTVTVLPLLNEAEIDFLKKGLWFQAIKAYKERTQQTLIVSKHQVDATGELLGLRAEGVCGQCNGTGRAMGWKR